MKATATMDISRVGLKPMPQEKTNRMLYAGAAAIQESIRDTINMLGLVKTGTFKAGVRIGRPVGNTIDVHDSVHYGIYLEEGTRPHTIKVKHKKALRWPQEVIGSRGGRVTEDVFARKVEHPGTRAYKPFSRGLLASEEKVLRNMKAVYEED